MGRQNVDFVQAIFRATYPNALEEGLSEENHSKMSPPQLKKTTTK